MDLAPTSSGYVRVNGVDMYYEVHGDGAPLALLHGSFSAIGTSFGGFIPLLAKSRKIIAFEFQAHGRTADVDRPLSVEQLADDVAAALERLETGPADVFGYSLGAAVALHLAFKRPGAVRKAVLASVAYARDGMHPGLTDGLDMLQPEHLIGSPFHDEYMALAPRPEDFAALVDKVKAMNASVPELTPEQVSSIAAPVMVAIGDSDIVRPEHAVQAFRLLGGGVSGDNEGIPDSRLAVLPGTSHVMMAYRPDWLTPMIEEFLDAPVGDTA